MPKSFLFHTLHSVSKASLSIALMGSFLTPPTWAMEIEDYPLAVVKQEPGSEDSEPTSDSLSNPERTAPSVFTIKKIEAGLKFINEGYIVDNEQLIENCLPCTLSFHKWIKRGTAKPEPVALLAQPDRDHMTDLMDDRGLLKDLHLAKLDEKIFITEICDDENEADENDVIVKENTYRINGLPLAFYPAKLSKLKEYINGAKVPWQQYEANGKTFKEGILFLPYENDNTRAHFLNFFYREEIKKKKADGGYKEKTKRKNNKTKKKNYALYIVDPQKGKLYTITKFIKKKSKILF